MKKIYSAQNNHGFPLRNCCWTFKKLKLFCCQVCTKSKNWFWTNIETFKTKKKMCFIIPVCFVTNGLPSIRSDRYPVSSGWVDTWTPPNKCGNRPLPRPPANTWAFTTTLKWFFSFLIYQNFIYSSNVFFIFDRMKKTLNKKIYQYKKKIYLIY